MTSRISFNFLLICVTNFVGYGSPHLFTFNPVMSNKATDNRESLGQILNIPEVKQRSFDIFKSRGEFINMAEKYIANRKPYNYKVYKPYEPAAKPKVTVKDYVYRILDSVKFFNLNLAHNTLVQDEKYNKTDKVESATIENPSESYIEAEVNDSVVSPTTTEKLSMDMDTTTDAHTTPEPITTSKALDAADIGTSTEETTTSLLGLHSTYAEYAVTTANTEYPSVPSTEETVALETSTSTTFEETTTFGMLDANVEFNPTNTSLNLEEITVSELYLISTVTEKPYSSIIVEDQKGTDVNTESHTGFTTDQTESFPTSDNSEVMDMSPTTQITNISGNFEGNMDYALMDSTNNSNSDHAVYDDAEDITSSPVDKVTTVSEVLEDFLESSTVSSFEQTEIFTTTPDADLGSISEVTTISGDYEDIANISAKESSTEIFPTSTEAEVIISTSLPELTTVSEIIDGFNVYSSRLENIEANTISTSHVKKTNAISKSKPADSDLTLTNTEVLYSSMSDASNIPEILEGFMDYSTKEPIQSFLTSFPAEINEANTESSTISNFDTTEIITTSTNAVVADSSPIIEVTTVSGIVEGIEEYSTMEAAESFTTSTTADINDAKTESSTITNGDTTESFSAAPNVELINYSSISETAELYKPSESSNEHSTTEAYSTTDPTVSFLASTESKIVNSIYIPEATTLLVPTKNENEYWETEVQFESSTIYVPSLIGELEPFERTTDNLIDSAINLNETDISSTVPVQEETSTDTSLTTTTESYFPKEIPETNSQQILNSESFEQLETTTTRSIDNEDDSDSLETSTLQSDQEVTTGSMYNSDPSLTHETSTTPNLDTDQQYSEQSTESTTELPVTIKTFPEFLTESPTTAQIVKDTTLSPMLSEELTTNMDMQESLLEIIEDQITTELPDLEINTRFDELRSTTELSFTTETLLQFPTESQTTAQFVKETTLSPTLLEKSTINKESEESLFEIFEDQITTELPDLEISIDIETPTMQYYNELTTESSIESVTNSWMSSLTTEDFLNEQTTTHNEDLKNVDISGTTMTTIQSFDLSEATTELNTKSVTENPQDLQIPEKSSTIASINQYKESIDNTYNKLTSQQPSIDDNSEFQTTIQDTAENSSALSNEKLNNTKNANNSSTEVQSEQTKPPFVTFEASTSAVNELQSLDKVTKSNEENNLISNSPREKSSRSLLKNPTDTHTPKPLEPMPYRKPKQITYSTDVMPSLDDFF